MPRFFLIEQETLKTARFTGPAVSFASEIEARIEADKRMKESSVRVSFLVVQVCGTCQAETKTFYAREPL